MAIGATISRRILSMQSDERLVRLLREGEEEAFNEIVSRYRSGLTTFAASFVPFAIAEEVVQNSFVKAHRSLLADEREIRLKPWLFTIVRNTALNALDAERPTSELDEAIHSPGSAAGVESIVENNDELHRMIDAIMALPEKQRVALVKREVEGDGYAEIAAELDSSPTAVRGLIFRARTTLRESMGALIPLPLLQMMLAGSGGAAAGGAGTAAGTAVVSGAGIGTGAVVGGGAGAGITVKAVSGLTAVVVAVGGGVAVTGNGEGSGSGGTKAKAESANSASPGAAAADSGEEVTLSSQENPAVTGGGQPGAGSGPDSADDRDGDGREGERRGDADREGDGRRGGDGPGAGGTGGDAGGDKNGPEDGPGPAGGERPDDGGGGARHGDGDLHGDRSGGDRSGSSRPKGDRDASKPPPPSSGSGTDGSGSDGDKSGPRDGGTSGGAGGAGPRPERDRSGPGGERADGGGRRSGPGDGSAAELDDAELSDPTGPGLPELLTAAG